MTYIVYPERRFVSDEELRTWFIDAVANSTVDWDKTRRLKYDEISTMAAALDDAGIITVGDPEKAPPKGEDHD